MAGGENFDTEYRESCGKFPQAMRAYPADFKTVSRHSQDTSKPNEVSMQVSLCAARLRRAAGAPHLLIYTFTKNITAMGKPKKSQRSRTHRDASIHLYGDLFRGLGCENDHRQNWCIFDHVTCTHLGRADHSLPSLPKTLQTSRCGL